MAQFILKDNRGKENTFDHETIFVRGVDGELMPFTHGTGNPVLEELEVTENGNYTPSEGVDGFGSVKVNVPDIPAVVQPLEVTENGTYTAPDGVDGYSPVTVNVAEEKTEIILEETTLTGFASNSAYGGLYTKDMESGVFEIELGKEYLVMWDGNIYDVIAEDASALIPGAVFIGNGTPMGLGGNGEPFAIGYTPYGVTLFGLDTKTSHTVSVIKRVRPEPIFLQDISVTENGEYVHDAIYDGIGKVTVNVVATSTDVRYVTFVSYDGSVEYGKKPVAVGDDCADPIARGIFGTPTRESDAQYNYTFYGWSTEPNGGADASWNKAITEDKTVYANFSKAVRYYTITYYDSDGTTVLKTESLAYGATPSYTPAKEAYIFNGWNPSIATVTGGASYTAQWINAPTFATATWEEIAAVCASGSHADAFSIGDSKNVKLTYTDGTTETIGFTIVDMDTDVKDTSGNTAALTLMANNLVKDSLQPASSFKNYEKYFYGQDNAKTLLEAIFEAMPEDLKAVITPVYKSKSPYGNAGYDYQSKIFIPTEYNLLGSEKTTNATAKSENEWFIPRKRYQHFANGASIKRTKNADITYDDYWTSTISSRTVSSYISVKFMYIDGTDSAYSSGYSYDATYGVAVCFCVG